MRAAVDRVRRLFWATPRCIARRRSTRSAGSASAALRAGLDRVPDIVRAAHRAGVPF